MNEFEKKLQIIDRLELKDPPVELFHKINKKVHWLEQLFLIQMIAIVLLGFAISFSAIKIADDIKSKELLETYLSFNYNIYGYE